MKIKYILASACVAVLVAGGCATTPEPEETIEERAQARWDALIERNTGQAWEYYTPGYRETVDRRDFAYSIANRPVRWVQAEVRDADCGEERCTVRTELGYTLPSAPHGLSRQVQRRTIEETWVRIDGQWWYVAPD